MISFREWIVIDMMEETLQIYERAQCSMQDVSRLKISSFGLRPSSDAHARQAAKSIQIQSGRWESSGDLKIEPRACCDPLDVPCTYHKGARHTLHSYRLRKKIGQECSAHIVHKLPRLRTPASSRRSQSASLPTTKWHVLVVSANEPPWLSPTDSEEARRI
jgi:hypothetical protein